LEIREVPSVELPRRAGVSNLNAFRDGRRVLRTIFEQRPGRRAEPARVQRRVELVPVELASPGTPGWVPAGNDRRNGNGNGDRRKLDRAASGYTGPERRRSQRRQTPRHTVTVYRAVEHLTEPKTAREPEPLTEPAGSAEVLVRSSIRPPELG
jgi:hypothetical protein